MPTLGRFYPRPAAVKPQQRGRIGFSPTSETWLPFFRDVTYIAYVALSSRSVCPEINAAERLPARACTGSRGTFAGVQGRANKKRVREYLVPVQEGEQLPVAKGTAPGGPGRGHRIESAGGAGRRCRCPCSVPSLSRRFDVHRLLRPGFNLVQWRRFIHRVCWQATLPPGPRLRRTP